jgi:hypothetical protein
MLKNNETEMKNWENGEKVCVQNTPKNRPPKSQQNQGVESSDLDVPKGNVS